jgi:hypothetical protein
VQCTYEKEFYETLAALIVFVVLFFILMIYIGYLLWVNSPEVRERIALVQKQQQPATTSATLPPPSPKKMAQPQQPTTGVDVLPTPPAANLTGPVTPPIPPPTLRMTWDQITPSPSSPPYRRNLRLESDENVVI